MVFVMILIRINSKGTGAAGAAGVKCFFIYYFCAVVSFAQSFLEEKVGDTAFWGNSFNLCCHYNCTLSYSVCQSTQTFLGQSFDDPISGWRGVVNDQIVFVADKYNQNKSTGLSCFITFDKKLLETLLAIISYYIIFLRPFGIQNNQVPQEGFLACFRTGVPLQFFFN